MNDKCHSFTPETQITSLNDLAKEIHANAVNHGWWFYNTLGEMIKEGKPNE